MGSYFTAPWYIYARDLDGTWQDALTSTIAYNDDILYQTGRFKHHIYEFALHFANKYKAIYLYNGRTRIAKVYFSSPDCITLECPDELKTVLRKCQEIPTGSRSRLKEPFELRFKQNDEGNYNRINR